MWAYDFIYNNLCYEFSASSSSQVYVVGCYATGAITIPSTVTYYLNGNSNQAMSCQVIGIGNSAFDGASITSVSMPSSVTSIGSYAFADCRSLTSISFSNNTISIDDYAFSGCNNLKTITIPGSVKSLGRAAFYNCSNLETVNVSNNLETVGWFAFGETKWFGNQPDGLVYVGKVAYRYKGTMPNNTTIELEEGTLSIAYGAFTECKGLTSIVIPSSVKSIGNIAFYNCNLASVTMKSTTPIEITSSAFYNQVHTKATLYVPVGYKAVYENAEYWKDFKSIVEKYESGESFTATTVEGVDVTYTIINEDQKTCKVGYTYNKKSAIRSAINKSTVGSVTIPTMVNGYSVTEVSDYAFFDCKNLTLVTLPSSIKYFGKSALSGCSSLQSIEIPLGISSISESMFSGCKSLTSVTIPESVSSIGAYAFSGCSNLKAVNIPLNVSIIENCTFMSCESLMAIDLHENIVKIGNQSFQGCSSLTEITIPGSLRSMETWDPSFAFTGCSQLRKITINKGAALLGNDTFSSQSPVETVIVYNTTPINVRGSFDGIDRNATLYVPSGCAAAYKEANGWSKFKEIVEMDPNIDYSNIGKTFTVDGINYKVSNINPLEAQVGLIYPTGAIDKNFEGSLTIPSSVTGPDGKIYSCTSICSNAFDYRNGLSSVTIPNSIKSIGYAAFNGCSSLTSVEIPNSVTSIEQYAFSYCNNLSSVVSEIEEPFAFDSYAFDGIASTCKLTVPYGTKNAYIAAGWTENVFKGGIVEVTPIVLSNTLSISNTEVCKGRQIILPVNMNNTENITALQFDLTLPTGVSIAKNTQGKYIVEKTERCADHTLNVSKLGDANVYKVLLYITPVENIAGSEGAVLNVTLETSESMAEGDYEVTISNINLTTPDETKITPADVTCKLTVNNSIPGDANGDGSIDVTDIVSIANAILGRPSSSFDATAADVNGDGSIDVTDIVVIANMILRGNGQNNAKMRGGDEDDEEDMLDPQ